MMMASGMVLNLGQLMNSLTGLKILVTDLFLDDHIDTSAYLVLMTEIGAYMQDLDHELAELRLDIQ